MPYNVSQQTPVHSQRNNAIEQRPFGLCSSVVLLTLRRYLPAEVGLHYWKQIVGGYINIDV